ncbi:MAG: GNAT family N-acetyltransferase [Hirschia sp.]|nr:GNAT family N-acetyltransferase [Hirschia sp.]MBF17201.1 GNAT family N-acetyltransferase [Hirschia sp.]|tara:strand:+ start:148 stop:735 length:588 start_codon:yes stop_codon:yes gene_type:complete
MGLTYRNIDLATAPDAIEALAQLRITVFREWPYLYDGDLEYERSYLRPYAKSRACIIVGAYDGDRLVGAATGTPLEDHADDLVEAAAKLSIPASDIFYCAESVLLADYRGQGAGHKFFDEREDHARRIGRDWSLFCAVERDSNHPLKPDNHRDLGSFWTRRGYQPVKDVFTTLNWKDVDEAAKSDKRLQVWLKRL